MSRVAAEDSFAATRLIRPTNSIHGLRPQLSKLGAIFGKANSPPRGDARRGIRSFENDSSRPHIAVSAALDAPWLHSAAAPRLIRPTIQSYLPFELARSTKSDA